MDSASIISATAVPVGWITNRQAAERLGVSLGTMTCSNWKYRTMVRGTGRRVRLYPRGITCIYPVEVIERIAAAQRESAEGPVIPEGFVDKGGAAAFFGMGRAGWKNWIIAGKVRFGQTIASPVGGTIKIYAVADLQRLKEALYAEDTLFKRADNTFHVPAEFMRREAAWEKFGVSKPVWERWEREQKITCGERVPGGPKVYAVADIERMLEEYGTFCPPYADPDRAGVLRVPLSGRDIKRREAIIDAADLPLIEGGSCAWSPTKRWGFVAFSRGDLRGVPLRRIILEMNGDDRNVRHVNGDPLDCRRENLVIRTVQQRVRNARKVKSIKGRLTSSRFKGVYWHARMKQWYARITYEGKYRTLGRSHDELAAAAMYDEAAQQWFGEDARLNFPDGVDAWIAREYPKAA